MTKIIYYIQIFLKESLNYDYFKLGKVFIKKAPKVFF